MMQLEMQLRAMFCHSLVCIRSIFI